nr:hypothetical protein [Staphylococcus aureus]
MLGMGFEVDVLPESLNDAVVLCESHSLLYIDADVQSLKDVNVQADSLALAEFLSVVDVLAGPELLVLVESLSDVDALSDVDSLALVEILCESDSLSEPLNDADVLTF